MASRRERCHRCGHQAVTGQCPDCQAVTRFQPFEPQVHGPSAAGSHRFSRASNSIIPNMLAADGLHNNSFNGLQPFELRAHTPGPRWFNRVSADINPNTVLLNNSFNNFVDQPRPWPPSAHGRKKALLCGVNYNGTSYKLSGCVNDVKGMRFLLVNTFGFPSDSVVILAEQERNPGRIPTKQNMRSAMKWLVQDCQPGDSLFFHYSGHGLRQKDYNLDELDGFDEAICPIDFETEGPIIDDEINATIVRPLPRGVKLHAVIDTCFSGTVLDLPFMYRIISREGHYLWEYQRSPAAVRKKGTSGGIAISFSACDDHQTSASTSAFTGKVTGVMTSSFIQAVQNEPGSTYGRLLNAMHYIIPSLVLSDETVKLQEPQLCSSEKFDIYSAKFML